MLFLLFVPCEELLSQATSFSFSNYSMYNGLSNNEVTSIEATPDGFIWVGTSNGLNCFDGYTFKTYQKEKGFPELRSNQITTLKCDKQGNLWVGTKAGLHLFNINHETFRNWTTKNSPLTNDYITSLAEDSTGNLWIGTVNGINRYNPRTATWKTPENTIPHGLNHKQVSSIHIDPNNRLWVGTWGEGLFLSNSLYDTTDIRFQPIRLRITFTESGSNKYITQLSVSPNKKKIAIATHGGGLFIYNLQSLKLINHHLHNKFGKKRLSSNFIHDISYDTRSNLWVGYKEEGIDLILHTGKIKKIKPDYSTPHGYHGQQTNTLYPHTKDKIWIGSNRGLSLVKFKKNPIKHFSNKKGAWRLPHNNVTAIAKDKNKIYLGFEKGYLFIKEASNKDTTFHWPELKKVNAIYPSDSLIYLFCEDGLGKFNRKTFQLDITRFGKFYTDQKNHLSHFIVDSNFFWISGPSGLRYYQPHTDSSSLFTPSAETIKEKTEGYHFTTLRKGPNGLIWTHSENYLFSFDPNKHTYKRHKIKKEGNQVNSINTINIFHDLIWLGTNNGLYYFDPIKHMFHHISINYKRGALNIESIEKFKKQLWLSSFNSIIRFLPKEKKYHYFDSRKHFKNISFNTNSSLIINDSTIAFGGKNGLNFFNPLKLRPDTNNIPLVLTTLKIHGNTINPENNILPQHLNTLKHLKLKHHQHAFSIYFALLNYTDPEQTEYAYYLEGVNKKWIYNGTRNHASYTHIPPGHYVFHIKAADPNGTWHYSNPLNIIIQPAFYQTLFFKISLFILILSLAYYFYRRRLAQIERTNKKLNQEVQSRTYEILLQKKELQKLNASKNRLFSIIGHDLRNPFNTLNGLSDILQRDYNNLSDERKKELISIIHETTQSSLELLENLLTWSKATSNKIDFSPEIFSLKEQINATLPLYQSLASEKNILLKETGDKDTVIEADRKMLDTIIRNIISNAIKFSSPNEGIVNINYYNTTKETIIKIEDNGKGMTQEEQDQLFSLSYHFTTPGTTGESGTGLGLLLAKELIDQHHATIEVISKKNNGTTFILVFPLNKRIKPNNSQKK